MTTSRIALIGTIISGIAVVGTFGFLKLWFWCAMYATIYVVVLLAELASYILRGKTISTAYREELKRSTGWRKFWLLAAPSLAVLTLVGLWVHLIWGAV